MLNLEIKKQGVVLKLIRSGLVLARVISEKKYPWLHIKSGVVHG